jgi:hypothetical protein
MRWLIHQRTASSIWLMQIASTLVASMFAPFRCSKFDCDTRKAWAENTIKVKLAGATNAGRSGSLSEILR